MFIFVTIEFMRVHMERPTFLARLFYLFITLLFIAGLIYIIISFSPKQPIPLPYTNLMLNSTFVLYADLLLCCLFLLKTLTRHFIHGLSLGIFIISLLFLKTNNYFQLYLIGLLCLLIIAIEFAFWPGKRKFKQNP